MCRTTRDRQICKQTTTNDANIQVSTHPHIIVLCETQVSNRRLFGSRNWADRNVRSVVAVTAPAASNATQAGPACLRYSTSQQGRCDQNPAAYICCGVPPAPAKAHVADIAACVMGQVSNSYLMNQSWLTNSVTLFVFGAVTSSIQ